MLVGKSNRLIVSYSIEGFSLLKEDVGIKHVPAQTTILAPPTSCITCKLCELLATEPKLIFL